MDVVPGQSQGNHAGENVSFEARLSGRGRKGEDVLIEADEGKGRVIFILIFLIDPGR